MDKQLLNDYNDLFLNNYEQNFQGLFFHPEDGRDSKLNDSLNNIKVDFKPKHKWFTLLYNTLAKNTCLK